MPASTFCGHSRSPALHTRGPFLTTNWLRWARRTPYLQQSIRTEMRQSCSGTLASKAVREVHVRNLTDFIDLIERCRSVFCFSDVHFNRIVKSEVGRQYTRVDAHFTHCLPTMGILIASLADGFPTQVYGGNLGQAQPDATSGWSDAATLQRYKLDLGYLIPDVESKLRYRAVVARQFPWRASLIESGISQPGSMDASFAADAGAPRSFRGPVETSPRGATRPLLGHIPPRRCLRATPAAKASRASRA